MDVEAEDSGQPLEETTPRARPVDPPREELELVEARENPEWWRGDPGAHGEVKLELAVDVAFNALEPDLEAERLAWLPAEHQAGTGVLERRA